MSSEIYEIFVSTTNGSDQEWKGQRLLLHPLETQSDPPGTTSNHDVYRYSSAHHSPSRHSRYSLQLWNEFSVPSFSSICSLQCWPQPRFQSHCNNEKEYFSFSFTIHIHPWPSTSIMHSLPSDTYRWGTPMLLSCYIFYRTWRKAGWRWKAMQLLLIHSEYFPKLLSLPRKFIFFLSNILSSENSDLQNTALSLPKITQQKMASCESSVFYEV